DHVRAAGGHRHRGRQGRGCRARGRWGRGGASGRRRGARPGELDSALYGKGALMLHALRRTVGDTAFFGTLRQWLRDHRYGNASFTQFEALAQRNTTVDLTGFFAEWVHGTAVPSPANRYPGPLADHK
ncbi:M1 family aminopeptidase, partial [Micromonospora sp. ALFpr18c]|uniref:M1 family aminopeptidase n=1 Tax=Micromonospora sp. ALFpr18c TaxID=1458665 RepID=UPI00272E0A58